jgi:acetyl-CoA C-acetyltransferase
VSPDRIPVIVGVGEALDRPSDLSKALEPLALMEAALREADADAGGGFLARIASLDVVNQLSWRYADAAGELCARLGHRPGPRRLRSGRRREPGAVPARGRHPHRPGRGEVCAVVGAEAQWSVNKARAAGIDLPWTPKPPATGGGPRIEVHPLALKLGVFLPVSVYPFYENAAAHHWGQTPRQALAESGALWSAYAAVAAGQPNAWIKTAFTPEQITTPRPDNRPIAWPYTKLMVANMQVNQGAAVIVTSLAAARAAGIPDERLVFVWGGAAAREPGDYLQRDHYHGSVAQDAVLETVGGMVEGFDALELYSCFPCVPKMARRTLGLPADVTPTVTGGLTFFGAPMNDYMTHAAVAMTRRLRDGGGTGLLYGQGEFVTKHHGLVLADRPAPDGGGRWRTSACRPRPTPGAAPSRPSSRTRRARRSWRPTRCSTTATARPPMAWPSCGRRTAPGPGAGSGRRRRHPGGPDRSRRLPDRPDRSPEGGRRRGARLAALNRRGRAAFPLMKEPAHAPPRPVQPPAAQRPASGPDPGRVTLGACAYEHPSPPGYAWNYMKAPRKAPSWPMAVPQRRRGDDDGLRARRLGRDPDGDGPERERDRPGVGPHGHPPEGPDRASDMSGGVLEARTSVDAAALSAFRRTGDLDLLIADERHSLDAAPADQRQVKAFFKACSA